MADLYVALVHYPVYDKHHNVVTSSVTNIDVHDIARSCRTYGVRAFYVVTPVDALRALVRRIMRHWQDGAGRDYNPTRTEALDLVRLERSLDGVGISIEQECGAMPAIICSSARERAGAVPFSLVAEDLQRPGAPRLLLLGTGWGLTEEVFESAYQTLEALQPMKAVGDYNHLSVRAAAAIILDRLMGTR